ncbi:concanavalin A-like lectin/glucanase domain-containing protein [Aspergillus parasiticus]|uniref:Endo-1,4-beta-xylanase n=1 Tax=Aspergillus parasiticus TaxID=5067 RepID=A0A5N6DRG5_ASPPA|nr:concanavalin A-like lectin/glucanase domain-containing protein [Aspergillus parasiticus]
MVSANRLLFFLPVLGAPATPTDSTTAPAVARSPEFLEHMGALIANATGDANLEKRDSTFKTSKDGVDPAGFYYSLYNANGAGAEYSEFDNSGQFKLSWNTNSEFLGGKGFKGGSPRSLSWDGQFQAEGDFTLAVYGWTTDPVTEWYVVEAHGTGTPGNGHILGQVEDDGGIYDVYMLPYRNVPEIYGVTNFNQLWSVRREARHTGTVDVAAHFKRWQELGLKPGNPVFQMVTAEGFKGSGKLDFTLQM